MRSMIRLAVLAVLSLLAAPMFAQSSAKFTANWTNAFAASSVCPSGTTANCVVGTVVTGQANGGTATTLCTAAGTATTCSVTPLPAGWSVFASWMVTAQVQYYGATAGSLLTTTAVNSGSGGNQISVQNLVILAPTGLTATIQ